MVDTSGKRFYLQSVSIKGNNELEKLFYPNQKK